MANQEPLLSSCRHCGKRVKFGLLKRFPPDHPKYDEKTQGRRTHYMVWFHTEAPIGEERRCKVQGNKSAEPTGYCTETVRSDAWSTGHMCNRKVKENGKCGIHSRVERQERERRDAERQRYEINSYVFSETTALAHELQQRFGIDSLIEYDWKNHRYSGNIIVNPRLLLSFLEEIFDA